MPAGINPMPGPVSFRPSTLGGDDMGDPLDIPMDMLDPPRLAGLPSPPGARLRTPPVGVPPTGPPGNGDANPSSCPPTSAVLGMLLAQVQWGITVVAQQRDNELGELRSHNLQLQAALAAAGVQVALPMEKPLHASYAEPEPEAYLDPHSEKRSSEEAAPNTLGSQIDPGGSKLVLSGKEKRMQVIHCSQAVIVKESVEAFGACVAGVPGNTRLLFQDTAGMKAAVRASVLRPYDVAHYYYEKGLITKLAKSQAFEFATLSVVSFNALWLAIDIDANGSQELADKAFIFIFAEYFFFGYFVFEWIIRLLAFRRKCDGFRDSWFVFDGILVLLMCVDTFAPLIFEGGFGSKTSVLRLVRLVKMTRMARIARLLRKCPELSVLIKAIGVAARSVLSTVGLLVILGYVFAVALRYLTVDSAVGDKYFTSVTYGMKTLLLGALMPDLEPLFDEMEEAHFVYGWLIIIFGVLAGLTLLNMLVGVLCEVIGSVAQVEKEAIKVLWVKEQLLDVLMTTDSDMDAMISKDEFRELLVNPVAVKALHAVGVDPVGLVDMTDFIFGDAFGHNTCVAGLTFDKMVDLLLSLGGSNAATVKDVVDMRKVITEQIDNLEEILSGHTKQLATAVPTSTPSAKQLQDPSGMRHGLPEQCQWMDIDTFLQGGLKPKGASKSPQDLAASSYGSFGKATVHTPMPDERGSQERLEQIMSEMLKAKEDFAQMPRDTSTAPAVQEMLQQLKAEVQTSTAQLELRFESLHTELRRGTNGAGHHPVAELNSTSVLPLPVSRETNANHLTSSMDVQIHTEKRLLEEQLERKTVENQLLRNQLAQGSPDTYLLEIRDLKNQMVELQRLHDDQVRALEDQHERKMNMTTQVLYHHPEASPRMGERPPHPSSMSPAESRSMSPVPPEDQPRPPNAGPFCFSDRRCN